jgi:hemoglobin-like flavoprotein
MSPEDIARVRRGFARIAADRLAFSAKFYDALFKIEPDLRARLTDDLDVHGDVFVNSLGLAVASLENLDLVADQLRDHGRRIATIGIENRHYSVAAEALLDAVEASLGDRFDQRDRAAWATAYAQWADITSGAADRGGLAAAGGS